MYLKIFICLILSLYSSIFGEETFGYLSASTTNIGDDFQSIAAKRFLPENNIPIDKELVHQFRSSSTVHTIINGWLMHTKDCCWWGRGKPPNKSWPPTSSIHPLLISIYFDSHFIPHVFTQEGIEYLKQHAPIGTRDYHTLEELQKRKIPSYFSGCLTLTLDNPYKDKKRDNVIYAVDIDEESIKYIRSKTKAKVVPISHGVPQHIQYNLPERLNYAQVLLNKYRKAKCVVTARLHAAMPCLAFNTPVLFFGSPKHPRFNGLADLVHHCSSIELKNGEVDFDFNDPPPNPTDYLPLREALIDSVTKWVETTKREF